MASRYKKTFTSYTKSGGLKYDTTIYEQVPESNDDVYVITQEGDRLDDLAYMHLNHSTIKFKGVKFFFANNYWVVPEKETISPIYSYRYWKGFTRHLFFPS